jgi:hypothetical protein
MTSSQVPESGSTSPDAKTSTAHAHESGHDDVESYEEGVFEQGKHRPADEPGQGVFEQGHVEPGGEGVFKQGHVEREDGSGIYDQDDEKPSEN